VYQSSSKVKKYAQLVTGYQSKIKQFQYARLVAKLPIVSTEVTQNNMLTKR